MRNLTTTLVFLLALLCVKAPAGYSLLFYDIMQIAATSDSPGNPDMNDNGYITWSDGAGGSAEIFLYDGSSVAPLTSDSSKRFVRPKLNNSNHAAWVSTTPPSFVGTDVFLYNGILESLAS